MIDHSAGYAELPRTAYLDHTLRRARNAAEQRSHRYVTLDHLLLALLDDPDAIELLKAVGADIAVIQSAIASAVNNKMAALVDPSGRPPSFSYKFDTLFAGASEDAIRTGRREVDGALALIAVAKDPESHASSILAENGFHPEAGLRGLSATVPPYPAQAPLASQSLPPPPPRSEIAAVPRLEPQRRPPQLASPGLQIPNPTLPGQGPGKDSEENLVEDMLASVRNILDAEERKERGFQPAAQAPLPPAPQPAQPRLEPQFWGDRQRSPAEFRGKAPSGQGRSNPAFRLEPPVRPAAAPPERRLQATEQASGLAEPQPAGSDFKLQAGPQNAGKKRKGRNPKSAQGTSEPAGPLAKLLENIPRIARLARGEIVQIRLSKEEAAQLFARAPRRGAPQQGGEAVPACRAVTIRLSAPEGGFFIETTVPETQWILNRPAASGEEAFGTWAWAVVPNETGWHNLAVSIFARDMDANGLTSDVRLSGQAIKIRVRGNPGRLFWSLFRTLLLLLTGSVLTVGAWYVLKVMGKLPH